jgi:hypothetical protein
MAAAADPVDGNLKRGSWHMGRNLLIMGVLAAAAAAAVVFQMRSSAADATRMERFDAFRQAYADRCNVPAYAKAPPDVVKSTYLGSAAVQAAVDEQAAALASGMPCDAVARALKAKDFAVPAPGAAPTL